MNLAYNLTEINNAALQLYEAAKHGKIWAFHGEMGAGKTTLISALCKNVFNISDTINSPTFAIINEYHNKKSGLIYHMDWYRIKNEIEARNAGIEDCLLSGHLCLIEWPENAAALLPDESIHIYISVVDDKIRNLIT